MENTFTVLALMAVAFAYLYTRFVTYRYWNRRGIPTPPSLQFPFGHFKPVLTQQMISGVLIRNIYRNSTERMIGIFAIFRPMLIVRDPELIRDILIRDFDHFTDRGLYVDEKRDPLSGHLVAMCGKKWKDLRAKLTPVFTAGKLKGMISVITSCGESLQMHIGRAVAAGRTMELHEISACYATDTIASIAFGVDTNSIDNPNEPFRRYGRKIFEPSLKNAVRTFMVFIMPSIGKFLWLKRVDDDVERFMKSMVKETIEYREKNNISRNDVLQLLLQLRNTGDVQNDGEWDTKILKNESEKLLTFNEMTAQAFVFFFAGFETSSSTIAFCMFELAKAQHLQRKVQAEIDEISERYNNEINYESLTEMTYLEACIDETLRMYPILPFLSRVCTKAYTVRGTNVRLDKGTAIVVPVLALHHDAQYYPEPKQFIPERFIGNKHTNERPYLPFGNGPRICIGVRLTKMLMKIALTMMLQKYTFTLANESQQELKLSPRATILVSTNGIQLKATNR